MSAGQMDDIKNTLLKKNKTNENSIIKTENVIIQFSTVETQKNSEDPDISSIDLGECENRLKDANNIPREDDLIIFKSDIKTEDLSATYISYEIYHPYSLEKLNLSICNDVQISITVPVKLNSDIETLVNSLSASGYDLFNENDSFYNNICATYTSQNGTDMLLSDRKNDIYKVGQNQSMCQIGCKFLTYNITSKKAKCNCSSSEEELTSLNVEDKFRKKEIVDSFYNTLTNANFHVLKCYTLIINFANIMKNIGEILMSVLFIIFMVLAIIYLFNGQKQILSYIDLIIKLKNVTNMKYTNRNKIKKEKTKINQNRVNKIKKTNKKKTSKNEKNILNLKRTKKKKSSKKMILKKNNKEEPPKKKKKNPSKRITNNNNINNSSSYDNASRGILPIRNINNNFLFNVHLMKPKMEKKNLTKKKSEKKIKIKNIYGDDKKLIENKSNGNILDQKGFISNNVQQQKHTNLNDHEINNLEYEMALLYDKRTYFQYYFSLLKKKQLILFTFLPNNDYNLRYIKIVLFIIAFSLYFTINGFFFSDNTMHKVYEDNGTYDFLHQLPQIFYSTMISAIINIILKQLSLSEKNILEIKGESMENIPQKSKKIVNCLKIKFFLFFALSFILMLFFWYYISCFCAVYTNTQLILIKDTLFTFLTSMVYPFCLNLLPGIFRICALRAKNKDKICIYKLSLILSLL